MKFLTLLKKELKELLNFQTIITMVMMLLVLSFLGEFMGTAVEETIESEQGSVAICDNDNTEFTNELIEQIELSGYTVEMKEYSSQDKAELLDSAETDYLIVIPQGFTKSITQDKVTADIEYISRMENAAMMGTVASVDSSSAVSIIQNAIFTTVLTGDYGVDPEELEFISMPVGVNEYTVVTDKSANIGSTQVMGYVMSQSVIIPIVVFVLVMMASQMIINAVATEKLDKTLETLLSAPVSRLSVLGAKMTAAAIVALLNAIVYMIGFSKYMSAMTDIQYASIEGTDTDSLIEQLGLNLGMGDYLLVGLQLFISIMIALSASLILGALVTDAKQTQTVILPITVLTMIPYLMSLFIDINTAEPVVLRFVAWAIPFTHTFTAISNITFGNMTVYWAGLAYQVVFLIVCMFFAVRLFTSDKIFTISLNFGQKRKMKKNVANNDQ